MLVATLLAFRLLRSVDPAPAASLRFETGRHSGDVTALARDPGSGDWLTVGWDKAVRRWRDGKPFGVPLRFATGSGGDGRFASCAVSPQGVLAVGDSDRKGPSVWLYDLRKGDAGDVRRFQISRPDDVRSASAFMSVAFSSDGRLVAAGDNAGGVHVWDVASGGHTSRRVAPSDRFTVFGVAFGPGAGGRLGYSASASADGIDAKGYLGLVDAQRKDLASVGAPVSTNGYVVGIDWTASDSIAVAGEKGVVLWKPGEKPKTVPSDEPLARIARSADGKALIATTERGTVLVFDKLGDAPKRVAPLGDPSPAWGVGLTPDGRTAAVAQENGALYEIDVATGQRGRTLEAPAPKASGLAWIGETGLRWTLGGNPSGFDLARSLPKAGGAPSPSSDVRSGQATLTLRDGHVQVSGAGSWSSPKGLEATDAALLDETHVVFVTAAGLYLQSKEGDVREIVFDGGTPVDLSRSPDGSKLAVLFSDGVVRLYRYRKSELESLATLFVAGSEWVVWDERSGAYDSSVAGDAIFGFQVNRGESALASFVPAVMRQDYRRAGLLSSLLDGGVVPDAPARPIDQAIAQVPDIRVVRVVNGQSTPKGWEVAGSEAEVILRVQNSTGGQKVSVRVGHGRARDVPGLVDVPNPNGVEKPYTVSNLKPGANQVSVYLGGEPIRSSEFTIVNTDASPAPPGRLVVLAIGINEYAKPPLNKKGLQGAVNDARGFIDTVQAFPLEGTKVIALPLLRDAAARRDDIVDALKLLKKTATDSDRVMVFIASHGDQVEAEKRVATYITPYDYSRDDLDRTGLDWPTVARMLSEVECKSLILFTDNCHSGAALDSFKAAGAVTDDMRKLRSDISVFAACGEAQESYEESTTAHGIFTQALLQGLQGNLKGQGSRDDGIVDTDILKGAILDYFRREARANGQMPSIDAPREPIPVTRRREKSSGGG